MSPRPSLSSVSAKIFFAFLAMLAMFGGVTAYGAFTVRRLGDELRRMASGYLTLRLEVQDLQTRQDNLLRLLERTSEDSDSAGKGVVGIPSPPPFVKGAIDNARTFRRIEIRKVRDLIDSLRTASPSEPTVEETFLRDVAERVGAIERTFAEDEELFDHVYGPPRAPPPALDLALRDETARARLLRHEEKLWRDLGELSKMLRGRVQAAESHLAADERRSVWATVILAILAALVGLGVMALAQRALAPLRRLAAGVQQLARGDYKQRVEVGTSDEIGALASEFNAMAAALEEREQRLIRSERLAAVGKIAAQITHEVRNPLSSIGLNAELILDELDENGEARVLAQAIISEVDRLTEITEQYLRLTRLPRPKLEREDLNAIVTTLLIFLREEFSKRGITVETRLADRLPLVPVDENQMRQALLNILRNAAEAMPAGGRLTVTTGRSADPDRPVEVCIADTGQGIPDDIRAKIFDPLFSTKAGGTGLGLPLTQQIVVEHGGALEVDSHSGRGTRFTVRLPAMPAEAPSTVADAHT